MKGILGRKIGMTQVFDKNGKLIPVTVVEVGTNVVAQIKTKENDGYEAVQLGYADKREKLSNKSEMGHMKKANTTPKRFLKEIRGVDVNNYQLGEEINASTFEVGEIVDVTGTSKGKGFQGVIKRHNQSRGPMSHGSHYHRGPGSMGPMRPMRVLKGKNLPGHMGFETVTIQNLVIVDVDLENGCLLIKGNVPGPKKSFVVVRTAIKNSGKVNMEELANYGEVSVSDVEVDEEVAEDIALEPEDDADDVEEAENSEIEETVAEEQKSEVEEEVPETTEEENESSQDEEQE